MAARELQDEINRAAQCVEDFVMTDGMIEACARIQRLDRIADTPGPYAKAFREKFPVPEFPGIEKEES